MEKIITCVMGDNCVKFLDMCFESILESDKIIFCWGEEDTKTKDKFEEWKKEYSNKFEIISLKYGQDNLGQNGITRNFYLNYLKKNYQDYWVLCLDADEIVDDLSKIKEFIQMAAKDKLYSVHMRHLIGDLGHEDATQKVHHVLNRLFYIGEDLVYPEVEHPVLQGENRENLQCNVTTIWHLAYAQMWDIKKRYFNHLKKSNIHTPEYLKNWYFSHLFGQYPKTPIDIRELPKQLLKEFGIDPDEIYFMNRDIEIKHHMQVKQWYDYFKPLSVLDLGCGKGPYLFYWNWFVQDILGVELSEWAVKNSFIPEKVKQGDISQMMIRDYDLITCIDVLEHLDDNQLDKTLKTISDSGKQFLFSIPFKGDPNLEADKTHKQFKTKEEWIELIQGYGIQIKETPNWLFKEQILVGEK